MNFEVRYPSHPEDVKTYDTGRIRRDCYVNPLFTPVKDRMVYSHFDRMILAGIQAVKNPVNLEPAGYQMSEYFLDRRELKLINIGGKGKVITDEETVISPSLSIHTASGTCIYIITWGMAGFDSDTSVV